MIGLRRIALSLAALALVASCSSDDDPATVATASSTVRSSDAPTSTSASTVAGGVEFAECGDAPVAEVESVTPDFNGDGVNDLVVDVVCETSTVGAPHLLVAFVGLRREVLVDVCAPGVANCPPEVEQGQMVGDSNLTIDDAGRVVFQARGYSAGAPLCCPDLDVRRAFRWTGEGFEEEAA